MSIKVKRDAVVSTVSRVSVVMGGTPRPSVRISVLKDNTLRPIAEFATS